MCIRHVESTNPGRSRPSLAFRSERSQKLRFLKWLIEAARGLGRIFRDPKLVQCTRRLHLTRRRSNIKGRSYRLTLNVIGPSVIDLFITEKLAIDYTIKITVVS